MATGKCRQPPQATRFLRWGRMLPSLWLNMAGWSISVWLNLGNFQDIAKFDTIWRVWKSRSPMHLPFISHIPMISPHLITILHPNSEPLTISVKGLAEASAQRGSLDAMARGELDAMVIVVVTRKKVEKLVERCRI